MKKQNKKLFWIVVSLLGAALAAPIHVFVKIALDATDPYFYNFLRYAIVFVACLPLLFMVKFKNAPRYLPHLLYSAVTMAISVTFYTLATDDSKASLVSILSLLAPVFFLIISGRVIGEKFSGKEVVGASVSFLGALLVVAFPLVTHGLLSTVAYPEASIYMIIGTLAYAASLVFMRTANERGASLLLIIFVQAAVSMISSYMLFVAIGDQSRAALTTDLLLTAGYPALVIALVVRALDTIVYEKVGSVVISLTAYVNVVLSVVVASIVLSESISIPTFIGGVLIIAGIIVAEWNTKHHKSAHHRFKHH